MTGAQGDSLVYVSTEHAAAALGVSVSTIKRWVDEGVLPAQRTPGGHRKLLRAEVLALARRGDVPHGDLGALGAGPRLRAATIDVEAVGASVFEAIEAARGGEVRAIIRHAYRAGMTIETLADRVIAPVLARVGHGWETGRIDIWQEHRGTQLVLRALDMLTEELEPRSEGSRPVALGAAPAGDPYLLPSLLAQMVLLDGGWQAVNLGPNTPLPSLQKAMHELRPKLVWLSVSHLADPGAFLSAYRALYQDAEQHGVAVAIGGQALTAPLRAAIPYTTYGDGLSQLAAFARTLHPRPRPPRRGRPPR